MARGNLPPIDDPRISLLVSIYAEAARDLAFALESMMLERGVRRFTLLQRIMNILGKLERDTDQWTAQFIRQFVEETDKEVVQALTSAGAVAREQLGASINEEAIRNLALSMSNNLSKARSSVANLATRIFRNPAVEREFPQIAFEVRRQVGVGLAAGEATEEVRRRVQRELSKQFTDDVVSVIGRNGRRYTFDLRYYAGMVASAIKRQARSVATISRAVEAGHDLVRVSPNPSSIGDWCDAYRGRVFSVSGGHSFFPPLAATPNGGPPFHPFCAHSISVHIPEFFTEKQNRHFAQVRPDMLLRPNETNPNRIAREWRVLKKRRPDPTPLRFA